MVAFGRPLYREGLISRRTLARALYGQLVYMYVGADEEKLERMRDSVLALTKGWEQSKVREIVEETLEDVVEPIVYGEALDLINEHQAAGRKVFIVSASPEEIVAPLSRYLGVDDYLAHAEHDRQGRSLQRHHRLLLLRTEQGRGDAQDRRGARHRLVALVRLQRLGNGSADARVRRTSGGREPRPRAGARRGGIRLGRQDVHAASPPTGPRADADRQVHHRSRIGRRGRGDRRWRLVVVAPRT